jgi:peptidyl-dipeptidase Dcp
MNWHSVENEANFKPALVLKTKRKNMTLSKRSAYKIPSLFCTYLGGYSAGYYAYTWSKTLDYNVYDWMKANGGLTRKIVSVLENTFYLWGIV